MRGTRVGERRQLHSQPAAGRIAHDLYQYQPIGFSSRLMNTCLVSRYSSTPQCPSSRPKPDALYPPHGASTKVGCMWLTHTIPASSALTTRNALKMSRVQTAAASP